MEKSNHAVFPGCLALALENISRQAVAEISFQPSEPNTRTGSPVSLHGPAISLCLLPVEFSANYAVFVIRILAASLPLADARIYTDEGCGGESQNNASGTLILIAIIPRAGRRDAHPHE